MGYQKIAFVYFCLLLVGCTTAIQRVEEAYWNLQKNIRKPGEHSLGLPEKIWEQYNCSNVERPFIKIENHEVIPRRLNAGEEFNQRLVYSMCSNKRADEVVGLLVTRIYFQGEEIVNDADKDFSVKPGRWRVDTFVTLPPTVDTGVYSIELQFISSTLKFREIQSFVVQ